MTLRLSRAVFVALFALLACGPDDPQPKTPDELAEKKLPPPPPKPAVVMGAPRLCSGQALLTKLVAQGPLPPVDTSSKPGVMTASAKGAKADPVFQKAYEKAAPTVVYIIATKHTRFGWSKSSGTGTLIDDQGHVLTNYHVVDAGKQDDFTIKTQVFFGTMEASGRMVKGETAHEAIAVKVDPLRDLAILKVKDPPKGKFTKIAGRDPKPGEPVAAIGHGTVGLLWSMKGCQVAGIGEKKDLVDTRADCDSLVDATAPAERRDAIVDSCKKEAEEARNVLGDAVGGQGLMIQTDCAISGGDSGGPLIDASGDLVGVNQAVSASTADNARAADNGRHIHVGEVRQFIQSIPDSPVYDTPSPWCAGIETEVEDVDLDGQIDFARSAGHESFAYFFDLDQDTFSRGDKAAMPFDAEVAFHVEGSARYAWYDSDNDGRFDILLASHGGRTAEQAYRIAESGALSAHEGATGGYLLDAKHVTDAALAPRFGSLAQAVADAITAPATLEEADLVIPDPFWGGGRTGSAKDVDRDGTPDTVTTGSRYAQGILLDGDQSSTAAIKDDADVQKLLNERGIDAEISLVLTPAEVFAFYDTNGDGEHDTLTAGSKRDGGATLIGWERQKGAKWARSNRHLGRTIVRPALAGGGSRLLTISARAISPIARDEGLNSVPSPIAGGFRYSVAAFDKRIVTGTTGDAEVHLLDVDGSSNMQKGSADENVRNGSFDPEVARLVRGQWLWTFYELDGDRQWDVVFFSINDGRRHLTPLSAYRLRGGVLEFDADLAKSGSSTLSPTLFSDTTAQNGASELFKKLYVSE